MFSGNAQLGGKVLAMGEGEGGMEGLSARRHADVFSSLSPARIAGFAAERVWVLIIFYSIMFYTGSDDVDVVLQLLYMNLSLSMGVMAAVFLLASAVFCMLSRVGFVPQTSRPLVWCAAALMSAGAALLAASSLANAQGTVTLVLSSTLTGTGSAVLMLCYFGAFAAAGSRVACLEVGLGAAAALVVSFFLVLLPPLVADVAIVAAPLASAAFLCRACAAGAPDAPDATGAPDAAGRPRDMRDMREARARFSTRTRALIAKALVGALLIGLIQGFYDAFFGNTEQAASIVYDATLFIVGFTAIVILVVIACAAVRDMLFLIYKISMGLFVLACVLSVFLGRDGLYAAAVFFAGYMCFTVLLTCVCIEMGNNFGICPSAVFGVAFAVLYAGELAGSNLNEVLASSEVSVMQCCLVAICVLFCVVLFLFTETDLIAVGIGEVREACAPDAGKAGAARAQAEAGAGVKAGAAADAVAGAGEVGAQGADAQGADAQGAALSLEAVVQAMARDYCLSARETEVLPLLLSGRTISRIQDALFISAGTVSTHIRHIYHKTGVARKQELLDLGELYAQGKAPKPGAGAGDGGAGR